MNTVKIGPSFFEKSKNDYSNWRWAWIRELVQNSIDAGSTTIGFTFTENTENKSLVATCSNNGRPMDYDTLVNNFLSIGESTKANQNGVTGGFGKAKELIAFCHENYTIITGTNKVTGRGANYSIDSVELHDGTDITVTMLNENMTSFTDELYYFAQFLTWNGTITLNGVNVSIGFGTKSIQLPMLPTAPLKVFKWGVASEKDWFKSCIVRINGIPMYKIWSEADGVVIDVTIPSVTAFTANRDYLKYDYSVELSSFLSGLSLDRSSTIMAAEPTVTIYINEKPKGEIQEQPQVINLNITENITKAIIGPNNQKHQQSTPTIIGPNEPKAPTINANIEARPTKQTSAIGFDFVIRNETKIQQPSYFNPGNDMSAHAKNLATSWTNICNEVAAIVGYHGKFRTGFCFSDNCVAKCTYDNNNGTIIYLNPATISRDRRSWGKKWLRTKTNDPRLDLIAAATHEITHAMGSMRHDERYASDLTTNFSKVMGSLKKLMKLIKF